jgi:signal transduction histidine kinase
MRAMGMTVRHEAVQAFPPAPPSAGEARRFVGACLDRWGVLVDDDDVVLMVSELITNACRHAATDSTVHLVVTDGCLRVEVHDGSPEPVHLREHSSGAETGRGLRIVDSLARRWGVDRGVDGKTVWFEVPATTASAQAEH